MKEELSSVRKLRQEILKRAEDIEALEAVIETEGFPLDDNEKKRFNELKERAILKKINSMNPSSPVGQKESVSTDGSNKKAEIFVSNLEKNAASGDGNDGLVL